MWNGYTLEAIALRCSIFHKGFNFSVIVDFLAFSRRQLLPILLLIKFREHHSSSGLVEFHGVGKDNKVVNLSFYLVSLTFPNIWLMAPTCFKVLQIDCHTLSYIVLNFWGVTLFRLSFSLQKNHLIKTACRCSDPLLVLRTLWLL